MFNPEQTQHSKLQKVFAGFKKLLNLTFNQLPANYSLEFQFVYHALLPQNMPDLNFKYFKVSMSRVVLGLFFKVGMLYTYFFHTCILTSIDNA